MQNLMQIQSTLQQLPDPALQQYMMRPNQQIPQFMLLMEMNRRTQMRKAQQQQPSGPPPSSTVAQDLMAENAGITALPGMAQPQGFRDGGIVGYADGGEVEDEELPALKLWRYLENTLPKPKIFQPQTQPRVGIDDIIGNSQRAILGGINNLGKPPLATPPYFGPMPGEDASDAAFGAPMPRAAPAAAGGSAMMDILNRELEEAVAAGDVQLAAALRREIAAASQRQPHDSIGQLEERIKAAGAAPAGGVAAIPPRQQPTFQFEMPDAPQRPQAPAGYSIDDVLAAAQKMPGGDAIHQQINAIAAQRAARAREAMASADKAGGLYEMGLNIAASKNPNVGGAIGEGGLAALAAKRKAQEMAGKDMDASDEFQTKMLLAQRASEMGNFKLAADIMNSISARDAQKYQTDASIYNAELGDRAGVRRDNVSMRNADVAADSRAEVAGIRTQAAIDRSEANAAKQALAERRAHDTKVNNLRREVYKNARDIMNKDIAGKMSFQQALQEAAAALPPEDKALLGMSDAVLSAPLPGQIRGVMGPDGKIK